MRNRAKYLCCSISKLLLNTPSLRSWAECRASFCSQIDYILAIHFELLMQPIVVIGGVGTLLGCEFNNINDNHLMVKDDNWELIQLGLLFLNSYPSNVPTRGEVEDTRLEVKAKDTKKSAAKDSLSKNRPSQGQGKKCLRPKTKNTAASALQKKRF